jgi:hypothetical protein
VSVHVTPTDWPSAAELRAADSTDDAEAAEITGGQPELFDELGQAINALEGVVNTNADALDDVDDNAAAARSDSNDAIAASDAATAAVAALDSQVEDIQAQIDSVVAGGGGAPTDGTYLVTTAHGSLSAEVVVGTTPGGELGGTWAAPTVDTVHSGTSHAAVVTLAEAYSDAQLATHVTNTGAHAATKISVADVGGNFASTDVEGALAELASSGPGGGSAPSGPAPYWLAGSDAPTAIKTAIANAGGTICDGTADDVDVAAMLSTYNRCMFTGTLVFAAQVSLPARSVFRGTGIGTARINGAAALTSGAFVGTATNAENISTGDYTIVKTNAGSSVDGIDINITSTSGFQFGAEGKPFVSNVIVSGTRYGLRVRGSAANDSKIDNVTVKQATLNGFNLDDAPDGNIRYCTAGSITGPGDGTGHGFVFTTNSANWHVEDCKAWFCKGDGFYFRGVRHTVEQIEAQDCSGAGIRWNGFFNTLTGFLCDSNSYTSGNTFSFNGVYGGLEIGLTQAGASQGGDDSVIVGGQAWDKNEGSRGYNQKYGVRVKSGVRRLTMIGVGTGATSETHHNLTDGILFNNTADITHSTNDIQSTNHGVKVSSTTSTTKDFWLNTSTDTALTDATLTAVATLDQTLAASTFYAFEAAFLYRADATDDFAYQPTLASATGSWEIDYTVDGQPPNAPFGVLTSVTAQVAADTLTKTTHGLRDGDQVTVSGMTTVAGLTAGVTYYVKTSTANTFKVTDTVGGTAINLTGSDDSGLTVTPVTNRTGGLMSKVTSGGLAGAPSTFGGVSDGSSGTVNTRMLIVRGTIFSGSATTTLRHQFAKASATSVNNATLVSPSRVYVRQLG